jgi:hypothetical protein
MGWAPAAPSIPEALTALLTSFLTMRDVPHPADMPLSARKGVDRAREGLPGAYLSPGGTYAFASPCC